MARIVILGAGIGGVPMAFEMKALARREDEVTVVSDRSTFSFVPSNPWVAVKWRRPEDTRIELAPIFSKKGIRFIQKAAAKVEPRSSRVLLDDGSTVDYDYLVIATGPRSAFDEVPGLGPDGYTESVVHVDEAGAAAAKWDAFTADPGPVIMGAVQGASCYGPAYEFALIVENELRKRRIRDRVPITFVTAEPYVGHLGLGGVGDTKGMFESVFRERHIKWITNARVDRVEAGLMHVTEVDDEGNDRHHHELPFRYSMMVPAFTGIDAVRGVEGLVNPRGLVIVDPHQRNPTFSNIYAVGACIAIPPVEKTPLPVGAPKTGYMIESMVAAAARNIRDELDGKEPVHEGTWAALCLADFGDTGIAFLADPQIPPRNVTWSSQGKWVHLAKVAFEKYFLRKLSKGVNEPFYERWMLKRMGLSRLRKQA